MIMQTINQVNNRIDQSKEAVLSVLPTRIREELDVKFPPYINRLNSLNRKIETLADTIRLLEERMKNRGIIAFIHNLITLLVPGNGKKDAGQRAVYVKNRQQGKQRIF